MNSLMDIKGETMMTHRPEQKEREADAFLRELHRKPPVLPYEPALIPMLFSVTHDNSKVSIASLTALIEKSQKLAARVLSIANSAYYGIKGPVCSLSHAVHILGFQEIRSLVVMVGVTSLMEKAHLPLHFNRFQLWQRQVIAACTAKSLTKALQQPGVCPVPPVILPDEAYAAGLLYDIGLTFLASYEPGLWTWFTTEAQREHCALHEVERKYWDMDHAYIAACVLRMWNIPEMLTTMVEFHHSPYQAPAAFQSQARLLAAAVLLAESPPLRPGDALPKPVTNLLPEGTDTEAITATIIDTMIADQTAALAMLF